MNADFAWTANRQILLPNVRIDKDDPSYVYVPLRGYCSHLAVFDLSDNCIGWIPIEVLGHKTVKEWMAAVDWRDGGY